MSNAPNNLGDALASFDEIYSPRIVGRVNDYDVKIAHAKGEHVWHVHDDTDEFFLVIDGQFDIAMRDAQGAETTVVLRKGEIFVVPRGVEHKPSSSGADILMFEPSGTVSTGDSHEGDIPALRRQHERPRYRLIADETAPTPVLLGCPTLQRPSSSRRSREASVVPDPRLSALASTTGDLRSELVRDKQRGCSRLVRRH